VDRTTAVAPSLEEPEIGPTAVRTTSAVPAEVAVASRAAMVGVATRLGATSSAAGLTSRDDVTRVVAGDAAGDAADDAAGDTAATGAVGAS
jgi:hypothetical protein